MDIEIRVTELGESSSEWTFTCWLKAVGDAVSEGEPIAEVMTEKANVEIVSPASGILKNQLVQVDDVGTEDTVIGMIGTI